MQGFARIVCVAALACFAVPAVAQEAPPSVEAFGRLPLVAGAAISPDGSKVALAMTQDGRPIVNVIDLAERSSVFAAAVQEDSQLRGVSWADDRRVAFVMSRTVAPGMVLPANVRFRGAPRRVDYTRTGIVDLQTEEIRLLTTNEENEWQDQGSRLIAPIAGDPNYSRMIGRAPGAARYRPAVFRVDLDHGNARPVNVRGDNTDTLGFILDERGDVAVRVDSDAETNRWQVFVYESGEPRQLLEGVSATGVPIALQGLLPDGRLAALGASAGNEFSALYAIDPATGARELLFAREGFEIRNAINDPWTRQVVGAVWIEEERRQHFFDPTLQAAYDRVLAAFEGATASLESWSRDRSRILVYVEEGLDGGGYYLFTPATNAVQMVAMRYPELAQVESGERQSIRYRARDGTRIPAFLTLPDVEDRRNLPLVLLVHGGPHAQDKMEFDWWSSFLASRGYAVLQANFRGSTGYGEAWEEAGRRQWGGLMQTDVEDGVAALIRAGIADANRVCIVGVSYGGYAALAGATLTPDRYKCAASIAGITDLVEFLRQREAQTGGAETMSSDWWRLSIGDRQEDRERIRGVSPANLADRVTIPILLIHGTDDTVVPLDQSRRMLDRLRDAGNDVCLVQLRGDDHWLSDAATRIQMLTELEAFLAAHIGQRSAP
jgi:dipeptidyl aminopeptidase/acylaminoacyl peptidase